MRPSLLLLGAAAVDRSMDGIENMNGDYVITPTPNATAGSYNTQFKDYPGLLVL